jgi:hypothetical protein
MGVARQHSHPARLMTERAPESLAMPLQKLEDISYQLGQLAAYVHEHRHGVNNLSMKMDGLSIDVAKQIAALEAKMTIRIDEGYAALSTRLSALEAEKNRRDGASSVIISIMRSPAIGWLVGGATFMWGVLTGRIHL